jgi:hypothetical protein
MRLGRRDMRIDKSTAILVCMLLVLGGLAWSDAEQGQEDFDWYKTQFGTGGTGNCGPACVAMAIYWATGKDISVRQIREEIGEPHGNRATTLEDQLRAIENHGVRAEYGYPRSIDDIVDIIRDGGIAILWIHTGEIRKPEGDVTRTRVGRYYEDECGHYIVIKGYSPDRQYFIVHDPIPGDWATNTVRYPDGGMLGENRFFSVSEIWNSLMERKVIEISR